MDLFDNFLWAIQTHSATIPQAHRSLLEEADSGCSGDAIAEPAFDLDATSILASVAVATSVAVLTNRESVNWQLSPT